MVRTAYIAYAEDNDDRYVGLLGLAQKFVNKYNDKIRLVKEHRLDLPSLPTISQEVLQKLLRRELSPALAAHLATKLGIPLPPRDSASPNPPEVEAAKNPASPESPTNAPATESSGKLTPAVPLGAVSRKTVAVTLASMMPPMAAPHPNGMNRQPACRATPWVINQKENPTL